MTFIRQSKWLKLLGKFASIQILIQGVGFICGILVIRFLSKGEYTFFILANALQSSMDVLANSGITSALSSIGGKVWQDPNRFGELVNTAMKWRRYLAIVAVVIITPIMLWLLYINGASLYYSCLLTLAVLVELHFYLRIVVFEFVPRLQAQALKLQKIELFANISRLMFLLSAIKLFSSPNALICILASAFASGVKDLWLTKWVHKTVNLNSPTNQDDQKAIIGFVKTQSLYTVFHCIQAPLTVFLISLFGNSENIAEVGAISRLAVLFTLIASIVSNLISPNFARTQNPKEMIRKYWLIGCFYLFLSILFTPLSVIFSRQIVWILGAKYSNLASYVSLVVVTSVLTSLVSTLWIINVSKGWVNESWLFIPTTIAAQLIFLLFFDISNLGGILLFNLISIVPSMFVNVYLTSKGFSRLHNAST
jgi:hypothetical protein